MCRSGEKEEREKGEEKGEEVDLIFISYFSRLDPFGPNHIASPA